MSYLILTAAVFAVAAAVNTASVAIQQRGGLLSRWFGSRAWYVHLAVVILAWGWFLVLLQGVGEHVVLRLPGGVDILGPPLLLLAAIIWLVAFVQLGPARVANGYFFGRASPTPVRGGIFRWLKNPMYDAYALALVGAGLRNANAAFLLLAVESFVLLNLIEARIENRPFHPGSAGTPDR